MLNLDPAVAGAGRDVRRRDLDAPVRHMDGGGQDALLPWDRKPFWVVRDEGKA
jgi:hypothetical protein